MNRTPALLVAALLGVAACQSPSTAMATTKNDPALDLGAFSVSLAVKDLAASRAFYERLGFRPVAGDGKAWQILRNGDCNLGLFRGLFDKNILTFNPGWSHTAEPLAKFTDVRELQRRLEAQGVSLTTRADEKTKGPASLTLVDPDGNMILFDQHVN